MTTFMIVMALAAVMLFSAAASQSDFQRSRLSWYKWFFLFLSSSFLGCLFEMAVVWLDRDRPSKIF